MAANHKPGCSWDPETELCTCGALWMAKAYRFSHGGVIAFDQFGHQMPYYQDWDEGASRIAQDYPNIQVRPGEAVK